MAHKVRYSTGERIFIVKNGYLWGENATLLLRKWATTYKNRPKPSRTMISDLIRKFEMFGYVDRALGMNTGGYWFMQDGAPPHRTGRVFDTINSVFGTRIIAYLYPNNHSGALQE